MMKAKLEFDMDISPILGVHLIYKLRFTDLSITIPHQVLVKYLQDELSSLPEMFDLDYAYPQGEIYLDYEFNDDEIMYLKLLQ